MLDSLQLEPVINKSLHRCYPEYNKEYIEDWVNEYCGTVQTFQGNEANILSSYSRIFTKIGEYIDILE